MPTDTDAPYPMVSRRIVPAVFALYVLAHIDRGNIAYAKSQLGAQFGFDDAVYSFGVGVFYLGYALCEVPSNVLLARVGARRWLARILFTWGLVSMAMSLIAGAKSFYTLRTLLGVAEAGMSPGALLYLTYWFPSRLRARASACFLASIPIAIVLSGPLSGLCLGLDGKLGLAGWKWLFLLEGLPSVVAAFVVLRWLPDGPADARWLDDDGRARIAADLAAEREAGDGHHGLLRLLARGRTWALIVPYFLLITGFYGVINWLPPLIKGLPFAHGLGDLAIGTVCSLPYVAAAIAMVMAGRSSDRRRERRWHTAVGGGAAALGAAIAALSGGDQWAMAGGLVLTCCGMFAAVGTFWSLAVERLADRDRAVGIAAINALGCLGGFVGPGLLAGHHEAGLGALAAAFAIFAAWVLALRGPRDVAAEPARVVSAGLAMG